MAFFWLSFCDPHKPEGSQFLGASIVEAPNFLCASTAAHLIGCNPGGELLGTEFPERLVPPIEWRNRLLTREQCAECDAEFLKIVTAQDAALQPEEGQSHA
jgi:hypothetical protein